MYVFPRISVRQFEKKSIIIVINKTPHYLTKTQLFRMTIKQINVFYVTCPL